MSPKLNADSKGILKQELIIWLNLLFILDNQF